ncbi:winged helix-turn-helix transcriptional regulator [Frankia sp. Cppng1_Ct_nod]|uniref:winged helix-turn-helix transcriptional regulator n=1 Tax=Frankia sp. Cppng1_Ct_nod TaxID=2897162 RepID=UPI001F5FAF78|nr:winged helix-turn-helix transcriptional regulator [Frankia sp. Cppng1_Ct_nod]
MLTCATGTRFRGNLNRRTVPTVGGALLFGRDIDRDRLFPTRFRVTLFTARVGTPSLDPKDQTILDALTDHGALTSEIAKKIELSTRATRTRLARLVERGLVRELGAGPRDPGRRYFRAT